MATGRARERRSWPLVAKRSHLHPKKSFEAEDATYIHEMFHARLEDLNCPERVPLHQIIDQCHQLGRNPPSLSRGTPNVTLDDRLLTFTHDWRGPSALVTAECGLSMVTRDSARCYCCHVTFRALTSDVCIWTRHRVVSPHCLHLQTRGKRLNKIGQGQRLRRLSLGDALRAM